MNSRDSLAARPAIWGFVTLAAKVVALAALLVVIQGFGARFMAAPNASAGPAPEPSTTLFATVAVVTLLQTIALAYPVVRSRWHGWRLMVAVFVLYFGPVTFMSQIESLVYLRGRLSSGMIGGIIQMGLFNALVFSPLLVAGLGRARAPHAVSRDPSRRLGLSLGGWVSTLAVGAAAFTALYYLFGYYVAWKNPAVREYYGGTDPGSFLAQMESIVRSTPWMLPLQFLRGLLWVLLALPVVWMMRGGWWEAGLALSLLFAVPVLYLLFPNPFMPESVRMMHLVETLPYQFLFGWFVAWLLGARRQGSAR